MSRQLRSIYIMLVLLISTSTSIAQEVEVVIAAGLDWSQCNAFSPNNQFVAKAILNTASIWDVKTGRMIRNVTYSDNLMQQADSMWFSEDSKTLIIGMAMTNDVFNVDVTSGKSDFVVGPPMDYTNYKYVYNNRLKSTSHLYTTNMQDISFKSPDGKAKVIYKKIKNPYGNSNVMPYAYQVFIEKEGARTPSLDTVYSASFVYSSDSKYLFAEQSIYDLEKNRRLTELKTVPFTGRAVGFVPGTHIPLTTSVDGVRLWDFPSVRDIKQKRLINFMASKDGNRLVCESYSRGDEEKYFTVMDLKKEKIVSKKIATKESGFLVDIASDGDNFCFLEMTKLAIGSMTVQNSIQVYSSKTGKKIKTIKNCTKAFFTNDPDIMIIDSAGTSSFKYSIKSGAVERFPTDGVEQGTYIGGVSHDHEYLMGSQGVAMDGETYGNKVMVWEIESGKKIFDQVVDGMSISAYQISKDHQFLSFASSEENAIYVYELSTGKLIHTFKGHNTIVEVTRFSDDSKRLISSSLDGTRRVWNLEKGTEMVSLISTSPRDFAIVTPQQYYYATKGAQKLIHFVKGVEIFPFAQFDLKYNRPDIIIESLEASNLDLIKPFNLAYKKRLKRMGFTEEMLGGDFELPIAFVANKDDLPVITTSSQLILNIEASDNKHNLDRLMIRVNEVPIHGKDGLSLRDKRVKNVSEQIKLDLSKGKNLIAVSVLNEKGIESIAHNVIVDYESEEASSKPTLYLFTIGVSKYAQEKYNLSYASKDAEDIQNLFDSDVTAFNEVKKFQLTDEEVNLAAIEEWNTKLQETNVNDIVCVFYAGHGLLDADLNYFLASYDIDFTNPSEKGIPYEVFENLLDNIPARRKLMMIDACHSGEIDKDEIVMVENSMIEESNEDLTFRAINTGTTKNLGLSSSFELMKELFTDLRKSSGTVIISSAGGLEFAIEGEDWNNGVFTYSFISGITQKKADLDEDGIIMLSEMNTYIREAVFELTKGRQQPTNRAEVLDSDWQLW